MKRPLPGLAAALVSAGLLLIGTFARAQTKTMRFVAHADVKRLRLLEAKKMITLRTTRAALALLGLLLVGACTTVVHEPAPAPRVVYREMPPPVSEVRPAPPAASYNWVPGHYAWRGDDWRWQPGHYVQLAVRPMPPIIVEEVIVAPSPRHVYVRGHWQWSGTDWVWVKGRWVER